MWTCVAQGEVREKAATEGVLTHTHVDAGNSPVNESVAGDRQQLSAVLIVEGAGAVGKLHTAGKRSQTCSREFGTVLIMCSLTVT